MDLPEEFNTEEKVAESLNMTFTAFRALRYKEKGPAYMKIGHSVFYHRTDVEGWLISLRKGGVRVQESASPAGV